MGGSILAIDSPSADVHKIHLYATKVTVKPEPTIIKENDFDEKDITKAIMKLFETETHATKEEMHNDNKYTADEVYAMEQFKKHVQWKDGRYHVKPLLKRTTNQWGIITI